VPAPALKPAPPTLDLQLAPVLDGMKRAQDRDNLDAWACWAKGFAFEERQRDQLEDSYRHRLEPITVVEAATAPRRRRRASHGRRRRDRGSHSRLLWSWNAATCG
jgi:hypothetical protein